MESSTGQQTCQKCGIPLGAITLYIDGIRMCVPCYGNTLKFQKAYEVAQERHRKSLDKLGEL